MYSKCNVEAQILFIYCNIIKSINEITVSHFLTYYYYNLGFCVCLYTVLYGKICR